MNPTTTRPVSFEMAISDSSSLSGSGSFAFAPNGKSVLSGAAYTDRTARVWDPITGELRARWDGHTAGIQSVAYAPDGRLAAYCLAWLDEANAAGELEPVGTHPDFRRLGLAASVCRFALHRLAAHGGIQAVVYAFVDPANRGPKLLYESLGFREVSRALRLVKQR